MPIEIRHGSPGMVGAAAYAAGLGQARERQQKQALDIWHEKQRQIQEDLQRAYDERRRFQDYGYGAYIEKMRQTSLLDRAKAEREWQTQEAEKERSFRQEQLGMRERAATEKTGLDYAKSQYDSMRAQIDAIRKQSGGQFRGDMQRKWNELEQGLRAIDMDQQRQGQLNPLQAYQFKTQKIQEFLSGFDASRDVIPWEERPGNIYERGGARWQKSEKPGGTDTFIDWLPEENLTDQDIREGKSQRYRYFGGVLHQKVMGRQGSKWEPMNTGKQEKVETQEDRAVNLIKTLDRREKLLNSLLKDGDDEATIARKQAIVDSLIPDPFAEGGIEQPPVIPGQQGIQQQVPYGQQLQQREPLPSELPPIINSAEEARRLPPGTKWMTPDGRVKMTPYPALKSQSPDRTQQNGKEETSNPPIAVYKKPVEKYEGNELEHGTLRYEPYHEVKQSNVPYYEGQKPFKYLESNPPIAVYKKPVEKYEGNELEYGTLRYEPYYEGQQPIAAIGEGNEKKFIYRAPSMEEIRNRKFQQMYNDSGDRAMRAIEESSGGMVKYHEDWGNTPSQQPQFDFEEQTQYQQMLEENRRKFEEEMKRRQLEYNGGI